MKPLSQPLHLPALITLIIACGGCGIIGPNEPKADVSTPSTYSKKGLEFQYPSNWKPGEELDMLGVQQSGAESPGSAIVMVQKFPAFVADDIRTYAKDYSEGMKENVSVGRISDSKQGPLQKQGDYESIRLSFSITLLDETVPHECVIYRKMEDGHVLFIMTQAATEDLHTAQPGFDLVLKTAKIRTPPPD
ncbi:MAG: hypothetical protein CMO66_04130 [Verrucomicrobiales bacterium]|nr:hypothetical protein [Verrucomicrobiales bacterium]